MLREVEEETGIEAAIVPTVAPYAHTEPRQLPPPVTIGVYNIDEPGNPHQHIDFVYFTRPVADEPSALPSNHEHWRWVSAHELRTAPVVFEGPDGPAAVPDDVRRLALAAIAALDTPAVDAPAASAGAA